MSMRFCASRSSSSALAVSPASTASRTAFSRVFNSERSALLCAYRLMVWRLRFFWDLMLAAGLDFDSLYTSYVGKNVLNFFRQDHGYKEGSYIKNWADREDNEHLVEVLASLDHGAADFADEVYAALALRYRELVSAPR